MHSWAIPWLCAGGGLGGTRRGAPHENIKYSGRVDERLVIIYKVC